MRHYVDISLRLPQIVIAFLQALAVMFLDSFETFTTILMLMRSAYVAADFSSIEPVHRASVHLSSSDFRNFYSDFSNLVTDHHNFKALVLNLHYSRGSLAQRLDRLCPPATAEALREHGDVCPVCREELNEARRLPCNHFLHLVGTFFSRTIVFASKKILMDRTVCSSG
jgi:hypothetical protein